MRLRDRRRCSRAFFAVSEFATPNNCAAMCAVVVELLNNSSYDIETDYEAQNPHGPSWTLMDPHGPSWTLMDFLGRSGLFTLLCAN